MWVYISVCGENQLLENMMLEKQLLDVAVSMCLCMCVRLFLCFDLPAGKFDCADTLFLSENKLNSWFTMTLFVICA